ncbi:MAG TPA: hypothetical protein VN714_25205 [Trebonia sp.]|nr:hypothetical protein [Trebonia sp.]
MHRTRHWWILLLAGVFLLAACTGGGSHADAQSSASARQSAAAKASAAAAAKAKEVAAQRAAACQQYCGDAAKDAADVAAACPDPAALGKTACKAWVSDASKLLSGLSAGYAADLSDDAAGNVSEGQSDLQSFTTKGCASLSQAASLGKAGGGASGTLADCEESLLHAGAALGGLHTTINPAAGQQPSAAGPVSPAAYKTRLAQAVRPLNTALAALAKAGSNPAYSRDLLLAEADASAAADELTDAAFTPPAAAAAANSGLASDLAQLARALSDAHDGAQATGSACATPVTRATQLVYVGGQAVYRSGLPGDIKTLKKLGYHVPLTLPSLPGQQNRRLANGTLVKDVARGGAGILYIDNGGSTDAVVSLAKSKHAAFAVFVRKHSSTQVSGVSDGTYGIYLTTGADWDQGRQSFSRGCDYQKFDETVDFKTSYLATETDYTTYHITLTAVVGGTATLSEIGPGDFPH